MKKLFLALALVLSLVITAKSQTVSFGTNHIENSQTHIPIIFQDICDVSSISLTFTYDTTLLNYSNNIVVDQSLVNGMLITNNINSQIRISWFSSGNDITLTNDTIFEIVFDNKKLGSTNLSWQFQDPFGNYDPEACQVTQGAYPIMNVCFEDNYITVGQYNVNISGYVNYHNSSSLIYPINVYLYDEYLGYITSQGSTDGNFSFQNLPCGTYSIDASTMIPSGGYNAVDALLTAKYFTGMNQLDPVQKLAADVNNTGSVNSSDALIILQKFTSGIPFQSPWIFKWNTISVYSNSSIYNVEGICRGDVNNSFMSSNGSKMLLDTINIKFVRDTIIGDTTFISVLIENSPQLIDAIDLTFSFNQSIYSYTKTIFPDNQLINNSINVINNKYLFAWFNSGNAATISDGKILTVVFNKVSQGCGEFLWNPSSDSCNFFSLSSNYFNVNFESNDSICNYYDVVVGIQTYFENPPKIYSYDNKVIIENTNYKQVEIYDMLGRIVMTEQLMNGDNTISINKKGMYIIRLSKDGRIINKKIMI